MSSQSQGAERHGPINWKNHTCVLMKISACRLCYVCVGPTKMLCRTQFNHLNLFGFFCSIHEEKKKILTYFVQVYEYIYVCIWTGYIDRYSIIAEGLLFITKFEKLPCFKKKEKKEQILSALYMLQQLHRGQPAVTRATATLRFATRSFFKRVKTSITTFCLFDNEKIYMNLKILSNMGRLQCNFTENVCNFIVLKVCPPKYCW